MKAIAICAGVLLCCGMAPAATTIDLYYSHDFSFSAAAAGNPFDVELSGEFTGPDGVRLRVPGFYDGGGVWKIRFSPTREDVGLCGPFHEPWRSTARRNPKSTARRTGIRKFMAG